MRTPVGRPQRLGVPRLDCAIAAGLTSIRYQISDCFHRGRSRDAVHQDHSSSARMHRVNFGSGTDEGTPQTEAAERVLDILGGLLSVITYNHVEAITRVCRPEWRRRQNMPIDNHAGRRTSIEEMSSSAARRAAGGRSPTIREESVSATPSTFLPRSARPQPAARAYCRGRR